jgi:hypothetical protein
MVTVLCGEKMALLILSRIAGEVASVARRRGKR